MRDQPRSASSVSRVVGLALLAVLVLAVLYIIQLIPGPSRLPLRYTIGKIDDRFGLSRDQLRTALKSAESVWERAAGRDLFALDDTAPLSVNLIYDQRQRDNRARAVAERSIADESRSIDALRATYDDLMIKKNAVEQNLRSLQTEFNLALSRYNQDVADWNARGGAPADVMDQLNARRSALNAMQSRIGEMGAELDRRVAELNQVGASINAHAEAVNAEATAYNERIARTQDFERGIFDGKEINIYEFTDSRDLALVLAHEFGHYLGVQHVHDPSALMFAKFGKQNPDRIALTSEELSQLLQSVKTLEGR